MRMLRRARYRLCEWYERRWVASRIDEWTHKHGLSWICWRLGRLADSQW